MSLLIDDRFAALSQGDHVCAVYSDPAEQAGAMVRYIHTGIEIGERCVYIIDDRSIDEVRGRLAADGVELGAAIEGGRLLLLSKRESYLRDGEFCPPAMIEFLRAAERDALAAGRTGLRVTGEMTWALGSEIGCERVIEYEVALNGFFPGSRSHAICQYNRSRFGASVIRDVLRTHPIAIVGQQVCPNPYFEPPHLAAAGPAALEARVDWMIEQLVRFRENEVKLQQAIVARDEFLSIASHELRTPLNALNLAVESLARSGTGDRQLARITRQVQRLNRLVESTFYVSRLQDAQRRLQPELCDLQALVQDVAGRFDLEAAHARSELRVRMPRIVGYWDRYLLDQIVSNLISNALKYGAGEPIDVRAEEIGRHAVLQVRDRGMGVRLEDRERIFERFERAVPLRSHSGFGLGLWIVRECADTLGGHVRIAEPDGEGSLFEVSLPLGYVTDSRH